MRKLITCLAMATALPALAQSNQAQSSASNEPSSELQERAEATETMIEETDAANSPAEENPPSPQPPLSAETINAAQFDGAPLPDGQSALTVKLQVLLDRAGISPGVIDGYKGGMSESAIRGFESRAGLSVDGVLDAEVWAALEQFDTAAAVKDYTIAEADFEGLVDAIPDNVAEKAEMDHLGYTRVTEALAEKFHMDEDFLKALNPDSTFERGTTIKVTDPGASSSGEVARIEIRKADQRALAFDAEGRVIADYPVAIGSEETPSPQGDVEVTAVAYDPTYSYNPELNFEADGVKEKLTLPPGPNGPVGSVWIDLSEPTYGLHGTPEPAKLFVNASHGCVRFSNWDAMELADMVSEGTVVAFVE